MVSLVKNALALSAIPAKVDYRQFRDFDSKIYLTKFLVPLTSRSLTRLTSQGLGLSTFLVPLTRLSGPRLGLSSYLVSLTRADRPRLGLST
jgi:hypothetical protein